MKYLILTAALILLVGTTFGQTLQKGNLVGVHHVTINLDPDVTMNQFMNFYVNKVIPEVEKQFTGWKGYVVKGIRGENINSFGVIWIVETEEDRNKYYNADGSNTDLGNAAGEKLQPTMDKLNKLGTSTTKYTDWIVQ